MPDPQEFIAYNALMMCDQGMVPEFFIPTFNTKHNVNGVVFATVEDKIPITNIPSFIICNKYQTRCIPDPKNWNDICPLRAAGQLTLIGRSTIPCTVGGTISFITSGQIPLPAVIRTEVERKKREAMQLLEDYGFMFGSHPPRGEVSGWRSWVPIYARWQNLQNAREKGDILGIVINSSFLVVDVVGVVSILGAIPETTGTSLLSREIGPVVDLINPQNGMAVDFMREKVDGLVNAVDGDVGEIVEELLAAARAEAQERFENLMNNEASERNITVVKCHFANEMGDAFMFASGGVQAEVVENPERDAGQMFIDGGGHE